MPSFRSSWRSSTCCSCSTSRRRAGTSRSASRARPSGRPLRRSADLHCGSEEGHVSLPLVVRPERRGSRPDDLRRSAGQEPQEGDRAHRGSRQGRRDGRLPAGALPLAVLLPEGRHGAASRWPSRSRGPSTRGHRRRRPQAQGCRSSPRSSSGAPPGCTTTRPSCSIVTAPSSGRIARCTSPTTRSTTRSSTSRPATSASRCTTPAPAAWACCVCWDQWFPEGARLTALQGAEILFYPTAIGWLPSEKPGDERRRSTRPGRRSSGPTPSPTACSSPRSTASAGKAS